MSSLHSYTYEFTVPTLVENSHENLKTYQSLHSYLNRKAHYLPITLIRTFFVCSSHSRIFCDLLTIFSPSTHD